MKNALRDIAISIFTVLFGLFLAHFYLKQVGLSRPIAEPRATWWSNRFIVSQPVEFESLNFERFKKLQSSDLGQGLLFIPCLEIGDKNLDTSLKSLRSVLHIHPNIKILLNITSYTANIDKKIEEIIKNESAADRVIIKSPYDNIVREIKRKDSKVPVGSGKGESSRLYILSSLSLEALPPLVGDFYFIDSIKRPSGIPERLLSELRRRNISVIVSAPDPADWQDLLGHGINGVIVPSAEDFARWFQSLKI